MGKPVSVFVCGVQKSGTTSLHSHFNDHRALSPPARGLQEVHFFDNETIAWEAPDYRLLESHFHPQDGDKLRFDVTPIYTFWPPAIPRIHAYNPSAKLIFMFRDPYERAWSQWCMEYDRNDESLAFAAAIREGRRRLDGLAPLHPARRVFSYIERGLYADQVRRALAHFPREQLLFLRSEDLLADHVAVLARVSAFLCIAPFLDTGPKRERQRVYTGLPSQKTEADRAYVANLVRDDVEAFAQLTRLDVSRWPVMQGPSAGASASGRIEAAERLRSFFADDLNS